MGTASALVDSLLTRCDFPATGSVVVCAVSGGADSTALLVLAIAAGCDASALHIDHGLRPGSAADADVVKATADRLGVPMESIAVGVEPGPNQEARARIVRYQALPANALTGHTADDQAETVILNLLRGAATGLSAMEPSARRPLLALRRAETVGLCENLGLKVVHDESNDDRRFLRNQIRHDLLPAMSLAARRDLVPVLTRQASLLRDDFALLDSLAGDIDPSNARQLAAAPLALARRAVRRWLTELDDERHPPDLATVDRVLEVARGNATACEVGRGFRVERHRQQLSIHHANT